MNKHLKYGLIGAGALLGLFLVALVVVALTFDPNDYKQALADKVRDATGRELTIHGDLELDLFPWLAVRTGTVELGNREGFGPAPFARVGGLEVRVKLLPLLMKRVEIGTVALRGLGIELARDAEGRDNWSDLTGREAPTPSDAPRGSSGLEIQVDGVRIEDAALVFTDAQASRQYRIEKLNVTTESVRPGEPINFDAGLEAHATNPTLDATLRVTGSLVTQGGALELRAVQGEAAASGSLLPLAVPDARFAWQRVSLAGDTISVAGLTGSALGASLTLDAELSGAAGARVVKGQVAVPAFTPAPDLLDYLAARLPEQADRAALAPFAFAGAFELGLDSQALELSEMSAQLLGLNLSGRLSGVQVFDAPQFAGHLAIAEFAPRRVLTALGQTLPVTADPGVFGRADLATDLSVSPNALRFEKLSLGLDGARLTGAFAIEDLAKQVLRFDLAVDALDLDRYLPPEAAAAADQVQEGSLDGVVLPAELVRKLDVVGTFKAGKLKVSGAQLEALTVGIAVREAQLKVAPLKARLYGGTLSGELGLDARRGEPASRVVLGLAGVGLAPLMKDAFQSELVAGAAKLDATLSGQGRTVGEVRRSLAGNLAFAVEDGAIVGFDLWHAIRSGWAKVKKHAPPPAEAQPRTLFEQLSGTATVAEGVVTNKDLVARVPYLQVKGAGKVDLVEEAIDYKVTAAVIGTPNFGPGEDLSGLAGLTFPASISGKFTALKASPDLAGAIKGSVQQKYGTEVETKKTEAKDKLRKKLGDLLKR
jgi:AsmA protein